MMSNVVASSAAAKHFPAGEKKRVQQPTLHPPKKVRRRLTLSQIALAAMAGRRDARLTTMKLTRPTARL